jgi:hypothetical protein
MCVLVMIEPIRLILEMYAFEPCDEVTRQEVDHILNQLYPEATWEVIIDSDRFKCIPRFENPQQETFYLMKWA